MFRVDFISARVILFFHPKIFLSCRQDQLTISILPCLTNLNLWLLYLLCFFLVPTLPPASVTASNTSSTSLLVEWERIPESSRHGVILGYVINYTDLIFNTTLQTSKNNWGTLDITLTALDKFRYYRIDIAGFTKQGLGPYTSTTQITDEDRKYSKGKESRIYILQAPRGCTFPSHQ